MGVFPSQGLQVSESYQQLVQTKFGGVVQSLSYNVPSEAIDTINRWVQDQMGDEFKDLLSSVDPQTQLLVATVASFQSKYSPPV